MTATPGTHAYYMSTMSALADQLEAAGNLTGAADVRNDIAELNKPRPRLAQRCDTCRAVVTDRTRLNHYADILGVDWVNCARCAP